MAYVLEPLHRHTTRLRFLHGGKHRSTDAVRLILYRLRHAACACNGNRTVPSQRWVTRQARQLLWKLVGEGRSFTHLIRDNDGKYSIGFDAVFQSKGVEVVRTPFRAPRANAYAERWVRSVWEECLDRTIVLNQAHLVHALQAYEQCFNEADLIRGSRRLSLAHRPSAQPQAKWRDAIYLGCAARLSSCGLIALHVAVLDFLLLQLLTSVYCLFLGSTFSGTIYAIRL